jgi:flagellar protein FlaG
MLIDPIATTQAVSPLQGIGARSRSEGAPVEIANSGGASAKAKGEDVNLSFPAEREPDLAEAISTLDKAVQPFNLSLNFSRDDETGTIVIKLVDQATGETVQQIPNEVQLHLSASLGKLQGQLINRVA